MFGELSDTGLREDGRRPHEIRQLSATLGCVSGTQGSVQLNMGQTQVVCCVRQLPSLHASSEAPNSLSVRVERLDESGKRKRVDRDLGRATEESVGVGLVRESAAISVEARIDILQSDGSDLPACVNSVCLALIDAGVPLTQYVLGCSVALTAESSADDGDEHSSRRSMAVVSGSSTGGSDTSTVLTDLTKTEERYGEAVLSAVFLSGSLELVTVRSESAMMDLNQMDTLLKAAQKGVRNMHRVLSKQVETHSLRLLKRRGY